MPTTSYYLPSETEINGIGEGQSQEEERENERMVKDCRKFSMSRGTLSATSLTNPDKTRIAKAKRKTLHDNRHKGIHRDL